MEKNEITRDQGAAVKVHGNLQMKQAAAAGSWRQNWLWACAGDCHGISLAGMWVGWGPCRPCKHSLCWLVGVGYHYPANEHHHDPNHYLKHCLSLSLSLTASPGMVQIRKMEEQHCWNPAGITLAWLFHAQAGYMRWRKGRDLGGILSRSPGD